MSKNEWEPEFTEALRLAEAGDHPAALRVFKRLASHPDPRVFIAYGYSLHALGHSAEAVHVFRRALELNPAYTVPDTRLALGSALFASGQKAAAIEEWKLVARMEPEYPSYEAPMQEARRLLAVHAE